MMEPSKSILNFVAITVVSCRSEHSFPAWFDDDVAEDVIDNNSRDRDTDDGIFLKKKKATVLRAM